MKTYKLHLIRHGLTQGNLDGVFVGGGIDAPLAEEGTARLQKLAEQYAYPPVGALFSSPMRRALESADILYPFVKERIVLEELRENRFGVMEGRKMADMMHDEDLAKWLEPGSGYVPEGSESGEAFGARTAGALLAMMSWQAQNGVTEAACVTHGGVIMSMLAQRGLPQKPPQDWMTDNGCGFTVRADAAMLMRDGLVEVAGILPLGYDENLTDEGEPQNG